jgi:hypothetical protein
MSNRPRSATFLDRLVDTRLVERGCEIAPIKSFLHQGLSVAQHKHCLAVSVSSRLAALTAGFRAKIAVLREAALVIRDALAALLRNFPALHLAHARKATFAFFLSHFFLALQPCHAPFSFCFDSPTGGAIWLTNACCDCFAFCKNMCG